MIQSLSTYFDALSGKTKNTVRTLPGLVLALSLTGTAIETQAAASLDEASMAAGSQFNTLCMLQSFDEAFAQTVAGIDKVKIEITDKTADSLSAVFQGVGTPLPKVKVRINPTLCELAFHPASDASAVFDYINEGMSQAEAFIPISHRKDHAGNIESVVYQNDDMVDETLELYLTKGGDVVLSKRFKQSFDVVDDFASWQLVQRFEKMIDVPEATYTIGPHRLTLHSYYGNVVLEFNPFFYRKEVSQDDSKMYFSSIEGLTADGKTPVAYTQCANKQNNCLKNGDRFVLPLSSEDLAQILSAKELEIRTTTTIDQAFTFHFPMQDAKPIAESAIRSGYQTNKDIQLIHAVSEDGEGDIKGVIKALESGANAQLFIKNEPLWLVAMFYDKPTVAKLLLEYGADINATFRDGEGYQSTGLMAAAHYKLSPHYLEEILKLNPDLEVKGSGGRTAFLRAKNYEGHGTKKYDLLYNHGANIFATTDDGQTALHIVASNAFSQKQSLLWLLSHGLDINAQDKAGNTPLHAALENNAYKHALTLIESGASLRIRNGDKLTPVQLARKLLKEDNFLLYRETHIHNLRYLIDRME